jgi:hypothetical protein
VPARSFAFQVSVLANCMRNLIRGPPPACLSHSSTLWTSEAHMATTLTANPMTGPQASSLWLGALCPNRVGARQALSRGGGSRAVAGLIVVPRAQALVHRQRLAHVVIRHCLTIF